MTTEWKEITDPEELFRLKKEGWEIEVFQWDRWEKWKVLSWSNTLEYRARPRQPVMEKVKYICVSCEAHPTQDNCFTSVLKDHNNDREAAWRFTACKVAESIGRGMK